MHMIQLSAADGSPFAFQSSAVVSTTRVGPGTAILFRHGRTMYVELSRPAVAALIASADDEVIGGDPATLIDRHGYEVRLDASRIIYVQASDGGTLVVDEAGALREVAEPFDEVMALLYSPMPIEVDESRLVLGTVTQH